MAKPASSLPRPARALLIALGVIVALGVAAVIGVNGYVRVAFAPFYERAERAFPIPGAGVGFVCQDLDCLDDGQTWLFSGYQADGSPSPLYRRAADGSVTRVFLRLPDGSLYDGHGSAVTSAEGRVYVACEGGYLVTDEASVADAPDDQAVPVLGRVELGFSPSFMNVEGEIMYAGAFYHPGDYETPASWRMTTPDGTENPSLMFAFPADPAAQWGFAAEPAAAYSIPGMIQGVCATPDGGIVLSQSFGLATSHLLVYDAASLEPDGTLSATALADGRESDGAADGGAASGSAGAAGAPDPLADVPLYCLDGRSLVEDVAAPPMTEGIESHGGLVYVSEDSASDKYHFGKLYGAGQIYALAL